MEKTRSIGVNVPAIHRIVRLREEDHFIVMERIHGETLEQLWPHLGLRASRGSSGHTLGMDPRGQ